MLDSSMFQYVEATANALEIRWTTLCALAKQVPPQKTKRKYSFFLEESFYKGWV